MTIANDTISHLKLLIAETGAKNPSLERIVKISAGSSLFCCITLYSQGIPVEHARLKEDCLHTDQNGMRKTDKV